jgi:light-regulated signal transduction histidine kinase (bacteriophytochrome)
VLHSALPDRRPDARLADVEQELQGFSYIVSHDLAASFRHVAEFSRLLDGEPGESLTGRQQSHLAYIRGAAQKCTLMMEQLLVFSRAQQKALCKVHQDADPTLRFALLKLTAEVEKAEAKVSIGRLGEVYVDPSLFELAVRHLLENAIKFNRSNVPPNIVAEAAHDPLFWRLRITDNGLGVEPAHRDKAFLMFQRLNAEDAFPGVGAGLAICRRIARRHGGEVRFLDCAEGACVELELPRSEPLQ